MFKAFVRLHMTVFIYIVSSVFQVEYPRTPRVAPLPWSGVHVPHFFSTCWVFLGVFINYISPALVHCFSFYSRIDVLILLANAPIYDLA